MCVCVYYIFIKQTGPSLIFVRHSSKHWGQRSFLQTSCQFQEVKYCLGKVRNGKTNPVISPKTLRAP